MKINEVLGVFVVFAGGKKGGTLIPYTIPIHVKLPLEIKGNVVGELLDAKGDIFVPKGKTQKQVLTIYKIWR